ncbi:hypothetical protein J0H58_28890 [bacterium]|nr:hypothetical protein [bacterium]
MPFTDTLRYSVQFGGLQVEATYDAAGGLRPDVSEVIPPSSTDLAVAWVCDVSALSAVVLLASAAMTVETNNASSPGNTIPLAAGQPVFWFTGCGWACPLTADVTGLYVTSTAGGTLSIRALVDPTP